MMNIGIVCEFNPFHTGHEYLIREAKRLAGEQCRVLCVMSGDFVQRGEPAIYSKFARAEAAVREGADLVVELPLPWSVSSAEGFARGAVSLLSNMGATHICFGSECGALEELDRAARLLGESYIIDEIKVGLLNTPESSFAAVRERVLAEHDAKSSEIIKTPNNILAVEYLKAIKELGLDMKPMTVKRLGNAHDSSGEAGFKASSELRAMLLRGEAVDAWIPPEALKVYMREDAAGRGRISTKKLESALLSRLRMLPEESFETLPDGEGGAGRRLYKAVRTEPTLDAVLAKAKTKRYALARLRRACLCAALGIKKEDAAGAPGFARVLSANSAGCKLLRELSDKNFDIITKAAAVRECTDRDIRIFELGSAAHDLYVLANSAENERKGELDWRTGPIIVQNTQGINF